MQIKFGLSPSEINKAIKEVEKYKQDLRKKCDRLILELANLGYSTSKAILQEHIYSGQTIGSIRIENLSSSQKTRMSIVVESEAILFLEFGAGVKYSGTVNPKASELGMGAGTYPGKGHWDDPNGWWYLGDDGEYHHSYGIQAAMPMYQAEQAIIRNLGKVARKIFRG